MLRSGRPLVRSDRVLDRIKALGVFVFGLLRNAAERKKRLTVGSQGSGPPERD